MPKTTVTAEKVSADGQTTLVEVEVTTSEDGQVLRVSFGDEPLGPGESFWLPWSHEGD